MPTRPLPLLYRFKISVPYDRKSYRFTIIRTYETEQVEHYLLLAKNRMMLFRSDRPLWRNRGANVHRFELKLMSGYCMNSSFLNTICEKITEHVKWYENFNPDYKNPKNDNTPLPPGDDIWNKQDL